MSYYDDRRYSAPRDRARGGGTAADYFDNHPRGRDARVERDPYPSYRDNGSIEEIPRDFPPGRDYVYERYEGRRPRRPVYENVRRASSVSGDPYYDSGYHRRSRPQKSRRYDDRRKLPCLLSVSSYRLRWKPLLCTLRFVLDTHIFAFDSSSSSLQI